MKPNPFIRMVAILLATTLVQTAVPSSEFQVLSRTRNSVLDAWNSSFASQALAAQTMAYRPGNDRRAAQRIATITTAIRSPGITSPSAEDLLSAVWPDEEVRKGKISACRDQNNFRTMAEAEKHLRREVLLVLQRAKREMITRQKTSLSLNVDSVFRSLAFGPGKNPMILNDATELQWGLEWLAQASERRERRPSPRVRKPSSAMPEKPKAPPAPRRYKTGRPPAVKVAKPVVPIPDTARKNQMLRDKFAAYVRLASRDEMEFVRSLGNQKLTEDDLRALTRVLVVHRFDPDVLPTLITVLQQDWGPLPVETLLQIQANLQQAVDEKNLTRKQMADLLHRMMTLRKTDQGPPSGSGGSGQLAMAPVPGNLLLRLTRRLGLPDVVAMTIQVVLESGVGAYFAITYQHHHLVDLLVSVGSPDLLPYVGPEINVLFVRAAIYYGLLWLLHLGPLLYRSTDGPRGKDKIQEDLRRTPDQVAKDYFTVRMVLLFLVVVYFISNVILLSVPGITGVALLVPALGVTAAHLLRDWFVRDGPLAMAPGGRGGRGLSRRGFLATAGAAAGALAAAARSWAQDNPAGELKQHMDDGTLLDPNVKPEPLNTPEPSGGNSKPSALRSIGLIASVALASLTFLAGKGLSQTKEIAGKIIPDKDYYLFAGATVAALVLILTWLIVEARRYFQARPKKPAPAIPDNPPEAVNAEVDWQPFLDALSNKNYTVAEKYFCSLNLESSSGEPFPKILGARRPVVSSFALKEQHLIEDLGSGSGRIFRVTRVDDDGTVMARLVMQRLKADVDQTWKQVKDGATVTFSLRSLKSSSLSLIPDPRRGESGLRLLHKKRDGGSPTLPSNSEKPKLEIVRGPRRFPGILSDSAAAEALDAQVARIGHDGDIDDIRKNIREILGSQVPRSPEERGFVLDLVNFLGKDLAEALSLHTPNLGFQNFRDILHDMVEPDLALLTNDFIERHQMILDIDALVELLDRGKTDRPLWRVPTDNEMEFLKQAYEAIFTGVARGAYEAIFGYADIPGCGLAGLGSHAADILAAMEQGGYAAHGGWNLDALNRKQETGGIPATLEKLIPTVFAFFDNPLKSDNPLKADDLLPTPVYRAFSALNHGRPIARYDIAVDAKPQSSEITPSAARHILEGLPAGDFVAVRFRIHCQNRMEYVLVIDRHEMIERRVLTIEWYGFLLDSHAFLFKVDVYRGMYVHIDKIAINEPGLRGKGLMSETDSRLLAAMAQSLGGRPFTIEAIHPAIARWGEMALQAQADDLALSFDGAQVVTTHQPVEFLHQLSMQRILSGREDRLLRQALRASGQSNNPLQIIAGLADLLRNDAGAQASEETPWQTFLRRVEERRPYGVDASVFMEGILPKTNNFIYPPDSQPFQRITAEAA